MSEYTVVLIAMGCLFVAISLVTLQNARLKRELEQHHEHFEGIQQVFFAIGTKLHELDTKVKETEDVRA